MHGRPLLGQSTYLAVSLSAQLTDLLLISEYEIIGQCNVMIATAKVEQ